MCTKGLDKILVGDLAVAAAAAIFTACGGSTIGGTAPDASSAIPEAGAEAHVDSGDCFIVATNYDQSCSADSDCVTTAAGTLVEFGDYCTSHCLCGGNAINKSAAAQYAADVAKTPLGSGAISGAGACPCVGVLSMGCCQRGQCLARPGAPRPALARRGPTAAPAAGLPFRRQEMPARRWGPPATGMEANRARRH